MTTTRQVIEEDAADLETAIKRVVRVALTRTHTALPGVVDAYDPATQTATVTPQVRIRYRDQNGNLVVEDRPPIQGVPVFFPRAGGFSITFPLTAGDPCLILFAERDISGYLEHGTREAPPTGRTHDYNDAIVLPGLVPSEGALDPAGATNAIEIRSDDGTTVLRVGPAGITSDTDGPFAVNAGGAISVQRGANELLAILSTVLGALASDNVGGTPLANAATYLAEQVKVQAMRAP